MKNLKVKIGGKPVEGKASKPSPKIPQKHGQTNTKQKPASFRRQPLENLKQPKQSKADRKFKRLITRLIILGILGALIFVGYKGYQRWQQFQKFNKELEENAEQGEVVEVCDNPLDPECWKGALTPKLDQENGETGVLIVGIDTREAGGVEQGVMNTDSIIAAYYNHQTKKTTIISLPRDLYVPYRPNGNGPYHTKINAVYATGEIRNDTDGMTLLEETVENITGKKIQYRIMVKLKAVEDGVDAVGGVDIDVPTYLKVQYPNDYPGKDGKPRTTYLYYEFQPGEQHMDGEHALVWSRFRYVIKGDGSFGSDFSRGERQQQVLDALKEKVLAEDGSTLDKANKYWGIFQTVQKNVTTTIGFEEVFAGISILDEADRNPTNIVLDPNFGGLNNIIYSGPDYNVRFKDETFTKTHAYLDLIEEHPALYDEEAKILIENKLGRAYNSTDDAIKFRNDLQSGEYPIPSSRLTMITSPKAKTTGVIIVDMTKGKKSGTTKFLAEYFGASQVIEDPQNYGYTQSGYKEDIKIIINPPIPTATSTTPTSGQ